jgi:hypothetical protein
MPNTRLLKEDDMDLLRSMFDFNPISNGIRLTEAQIATWCDDTMAGIKDGLKQVAVNFDDTGNPIAMSAGVEKPLINGWIQNLTLVRHPALYAFHSAKIIAPAMELLLDHMESKRYYKFWDISKVQILGLAKSLISRHTDKFDRYDYFDEMIIPAGKLSGVRIWDINRRIHPTMDMTVRLYVLRQEYRLPLL